MNAVVATLARETLRSTIAGWASLLMVRGILLIVLGLFALFNPGVTLVALAQLLGAYVVFEGGLAVYRGLTGQSDAPTWEMVRGTLLAIVGLLALSHPALVAIVNTGAAMTLLGIVLVVSGATEIVETIRQRHDIDGEGLLMVGGLISVVFGALVLGHPLLAGVAFTRLLAFVGGVAGVVLIAIAFRVRRVATAIAGS